MYEIRKGDMVVALTEKPNYIYCHEDGYFVLCARRQRPGGRSCRLSALSCGSGRGECCCAKGSCARDGKNDRCGGG